MKKTKKSEKKAKKQKSLLKDNSHFKFNSIDDIFRFIALKASLLIGNAWVFILMCLTIVVCLVIGVFFKFSVSWQLVVNLTISIITLLIALVIQNSQNRDTSSIQLKLDELIRSHKLARNTIIDLDKISEKGIKELEKQYKRISLLKNDPLKNDDKDLE